ncbi:alpha-amylase-like [Pyxicephalus adspersus]|uniref:alpha-amylase-like n=1 Tax=Pyxicephalus adspersus TaxID=30357 RepID=UPI003B59349A
MKLLLLFAFVGLCAAQYNSNFRAGRTSMVHLFEWRWSDIAAECERYLAPNGFGGVQISPPNENIVISNPWRPWYERYQPVSYKLCSRSGTEAQFRDMVTRCNNVGVYIYVDAIINHMCGSGGGAGTHSTCGSYFNAGTKDFSAVPYSNLDFNDGKCYTSNGEIQNYGDVNQVRNCRLVGLLDLALEKDYVRGKIAAYLNNLISIGVAGFRLDAAKHMWPGDIYNIISRLTSLNTKWFPSGTRPFIFQEIRLNMDVTLNTGLPAGTYCDVISGQKEGTRCTGTQVTVSSTGSARFTISSSAADPFIAIHVNAKL